MSWFAGLGRALAGQPYDSPCAVKGPDGMRCEHPEQGHRGWHWQIPTVGEERALMQFWSEDPCEAVSGYGDRCRHPYGSCHAGPHQAPSRGFLAWLQRLVYEWHETGVPAVDVWFTGDVDGHV